MTESKKYFKIDHTDPMGAEEPITNTDITVEFLYEDFWREKTTERNACKHTNGSEFVVTDLTGAFSGDEGEGTQFFFCSKKCTQKFIKSLGLDKNVFDPRPSKTITQECSP